MPLSDHFRSMSERMQVKVLTVDPASNRVEATTRDGAVIQIDVSGSGSGVFIWPQENEVWMVERQNISWRLLGRISSPDDASAPMSDLAAGEGRIDTVVLKNRNGQRFALSSEVVTDGGINIDADPYNGDFAAAFADLPESATGRKTGKLIVPAGTVRNISSTINVSDCSGLTIQGIGGPSDNAGRPLIIWTGGAGSGSLINAASASGLKLENLVLAYNNAAYDGDLVKFGHSTRAVDAFYPRIERCYLAGISGASGARSLVNLSRVVGGTLLGNQWIGAQRGILGVDTYGSTYANGVTIANQNVFNHFSSSAICRPGEAWTIEGNVFEPAVNGSPHGIDCEDIFALGLTIIGNWFGDVPNGAPAGAWISVRGRSVHVVNNTIKIESAGSPHRAVVFRNVIGGSISHNYFLGGGGLAANSDAKVFDFEAVSGANCDRIEVENNYFTNIRLDISEAGLTSGEYRNNTGMSDRRLGLPTALPTYTVATLPAAATYPACVIYVSDGGAGGVVRVSNGTTWVSIG
jgi:hypothetical protein